MPRTATNVMAALATRRPSAVAGGDRRVPVARVAGARPRRRPGTGDADRSAAGGGGVQGHAQLRRHAGLAGGEGAEPERGLVEQGGQRHRRQRAAAIVEAGRGRPPAAHGDVVGAQLRPETERVVGAAGEARARDGQRRRPRWIRRLDVGAAVVGGAAARGPGRARPCRRPARGRRRSGSARVRSAQGRVEGHALEEVALDPAGAGGAGRVIERGQHAAAVRGVGQSLEGGGEPEHARLAVTLDGGAQGLRSQHAIIIGSARPF